MAEILEVAREGTLKTQIMYRANLSFAQLNEYLNLLLDLRLLEVTEAVDKTIYKTTGKGLRFLQNYREIRELLKKEKGSNSKDANSLYLIKRGSQVICSKGPL
jgi:predicted transcriptional regulator